MKVKKKFIGSATYLKGYGQIVITDAYAEALAKAGRYELLEGVKPAKALEPVKTKKSAKTTKSDK